MDPVISKVGKKIFVRVVWINTGCVSGSLVVRGEVGNAGNIVMVLAFSEARGDMVLHFYTISHTRAETYSGDGRCKGGFGANLNELKLREDFFAICRYAENNVHPLRLIGFFMSC